MIAFSWHFGAAQELKGPTGLSPRVLAVADAIMAVKPDLTSDCLDSVAYRIGLLLRWVVVMCQFVLKPGFHVQSTPATIQRRSHIVTLKNKLLFQNISSV